MNPIDARALPITGLSSIKFDAGESTRRLAGSAVEGVGFRGATFDVKGVSPGESFVRPVTAPDQSAAVGAVMDWRGQREGTDALATVGVRAPGGTTVLDRGEKRRQGT